MSLPRENQRCKKTDASSFLLLSFTASFRQLFSFALSQRLFLTALSFLFHRTATRKRLTQNTSTLSTPASRNSRPRTRNGRPSSERCLSELVFTVSRALFASSRPAINLLTVDRGRRVRVDDADFASGFQALPTPIASTSVCRLRSITLQVTSLS